MGLKGAYVDNIFYCPHHPDKGYAGEVEALKFDCECRKPKIGLFESAAQYMPVDKDNSWMVGDNLTDVIAGNRFKVNTVILGKKLGDEHRAHSEVSNLLEFARNLADLTLEK